MIPEAILVDLRGIRLMSSESSENGARLAGNQDGKLVFAAWLVPCERCASLPPARIPRYLIICLFSTQYSDTLERMEWPQKDTWRLVKLLRETTRV